MATRKQKKALAILAENGGKSVSAAMREAGYSDITAATPKKLTTSKAFQELMDEYLPDDLLMKVHKEGLQATKLSGTGGMRMKFEGGDMEEFGHSDLEVPDYAVRHKYLETGYKIKARLTPEEGGGSNTLIINITGETASRYGLIPQQSPRDDSGGPAQV